MNLCTRSRKLKLLHITAHQKSTWSLQRKRSRPRGRWSRVRWSDYRGRDVIFTFAGLTAEELKSLSLAAEAIPICREGVARWSQRVNEARPRALSHPATAADPSPDYCNEMVSRLLTKRHYISTQTHTHTHKIESQTHTNKIRAMGQRKYVTHKWWS